MGLFDKKYCDICGEKIHLLGNRKLDDGNMCSSCAKLISPFMTDRRHTSIVEMKQHLAYREENRKNLASFSVSETYGYGTKIYIDRGKNCFIASFSAPNSWEKVNPDIIPIRDIVACNLDVKEDMQEEFWEDQDGEKRSYTPPRYTYEYDFYIRIQLSNQWFSNIDIKLNSSDVEGMNSQEYYNYQTAGQQIVNALMGNSMNGFGGTNRMGNNMNGFGGTNGNNMNGFGGTNGNGNNMNGFGGTNGMGNSMNGFSGNNNMGNGFANGSMMGAAAGAAQNFAGQFSQNMNSNQYQQNTMAANQQQGFNSNSGMAAGNQSFAQNQYTAGSNSSQMKCPNCGQITDGKFCPNCGTQTVASNSIRCTACGQEIALNGAIPKFCPSCGNKIG